MAKGQLCLVLTVGGAAELRRDDEIEWTSTDDEDFRDRFPDEFLNASDVCDILDYLVDAGQLTELQADELDIWEESLLPDESDAPGAEIDNG